MNHNKLFLQENKLSSKDLPQCLHNCIFVLSLELILDASLSLQISLPFSFLRARIHPSSDPSDVMEPFRLTDLHSKNVSWSS